MAVQIVDPFETKDNQNIIDPFKDEEKKKKPKTPVEEAFGDLSISQIIAGKKKEDIEKIEIADPFEKPFFKITGEQLQSIWQDELGLSKENRQKLKTIIGDENTVLGKVNGYLVDTTSVVLDTAMRTGTSLGMIVSGIAGDVVNYVNKGIESDGASGAGERVTRNINNLFISELGIVRGYTPVPKKPGTIKSVKTGEEITNIVEYAKKSPENKVEVISNLTETLNKEVQNIKKNNDVIIGDTFKTSDNITQSAKLDEIKTGTKKIKEELVTIDTPETIQRKPALPVETVKTITDSVEQIMVKENITRNKEIPISLQVQDILTSGKYDFPEIIKTIADQSKATPEQIVQFILPSLRQSAQEMNIYSQFARRIKEQLDPDFKTSLSNIADKPIYNNLKKIDNLWRTSLVTQLATAVRNFESGVIRMSVNTLQSIVDAILQKTFGRFLDPKELPKYLSSPLRNLESIANTFAQIPVPGLSTNKFGYKKYIQLKDTINKILENFPTEKNRLFLRYSSDVNSVMKGKGLIGNILNKLQDGANFLNIFNRTQEFAIRRAVFDARLRELIDANKSYYKGKTLEQILAEGKQKGLRTVDIASAVDKALDTTFAKDFPRGSIPDKFIQAVNSVPIVFSSLIPFPRFLMNSIKFQLEYSPVGFVRFLSKEQRTKLSKGDTSGLSAAVVGSGLLLTAMALRKQSYAGDKWYEFKIGDKTYDTRPLNPFAAYLFIGDLINKYNNGTLRDIPPTKDILSVLFGVRGTTGLYIVDNMIDLLTNTDFKSGTEGVNKLKRLIGEKLAGFLTPLRTVTDALGQFYPEMSISRDIGESPFTGAFTKRLGGGDLPYSGSPTSFYIDAAGNPRARPYYNPNPLATQLTGLRQIPPKNPAEIEIDKLQIQPREIFTSTGIPELDRAYKDKLSFLIGNGISKIVQTPQYQNLNFNQKILVMKDLINKAKQTTKQSLQNDTTLFPLLARQKLNQLSKDKRKLFDEMYGIENFEKRLKLIK